MAWQAGRLKAYINKLNGADDRIVTQTATKAVGLIRELAPVDTGALRASVSQRAAGKGTAIVEETAEYALFVEFGTYKMSAQPHFVPGINAARETLISIARQELAP